MSEGLPRMLGSRDGNLTQLAVTPPAVRIPISSVIYTPVGLISWPRRCIRDTWWILQASAV